MPTRNAKYLLWLLAALIVPSVINATEEWAVKYTSPKVFIANNGQYEMYPELKDQKVLYAIEDGSNRIFFTPSGLIYRFDKWERKYTDEQLSKMELKEAAESAKEGVKKSDEELLREHKEEEERERAVVHNVDWAYMQWQGASSNVEIIGSEEASYTFGYAVGNKSIEGVKGYGKLTYKNIYPGIDVQYAFHPVQGFEYSFILQPGANANEIRMTYSDIKKLFVSRDKVLHIATQVGDVTEQQPVSYYAESRLKIESKFKIKGNEVTFALGNYDRTQQIVIDPWVQTPTYNTQWQCVWECEKDASGNVYIIGGVMPLVLKKYNSAGVLQWSYNTPYDTTSWLGTFATDDAGNSYVTNGSSAAIQKISTAGALVWNNANPGGLFSSMELWNISFNCDQTKLVVGGTGGTLPPLPYIYQIDMSNGSVTNNVRVTGGALIPTQEVRSITACGNGKYYFLTHDSIGYINQNFPLCATASSAIKYTNNGYSLGYKCENWRVNNTGIMALRTYGNFAFTHRGDRLDKRNFATSAIVQSAAIPSGAFTTTFGSSQVQNSGMDIDNCGNIYVGSKNQVIKYDQNLNQLATYATTFNVYDVHVSTNGDIVACGSTGNSGSGPRTGSIQLINAGACPPIAIVCCDASICQAGPFCTSAAPVTLTASTPGGTWSGPGITNTATGVFSPAAAGAGVHTIVYRLACGADSIQITVSPCGTLSVCSNSNGTLTVSGGIAPYTWQKDTIVQNCSACIIGCAFPPGCATTQNSWVTYATGTTTNAPSTYPIRVTDAFGTTVTYANAAAISPCTACPTITVTISTQQNVTCPSTNNGSATVSSAGGTGLYTYTWSPNVSTTATASNLSAGVYTVTARDANGCTGTATITISAPAAVTASATSTSTTCGLNNGSATATVSAGTGPFTYAWSNGGNTASISNVASGAYTVTVTGAGGCTATASTNVASSVAILLSASATSTSCGSNNGSATVTTSAGTGPFTYAWSNGGNTASISNVASGSYTVTVTGAGGCTATASVNVATSTAITLTTSSTSASCGNTNGTATVSVTAGTGPFTYSWSNGASTATASGLAASTYTVTVNGAGGCSATASATVANANSTLAVTFTNPVNPTCAGSDGSVTINLSGGAAPYQAVIDTGGTPVNITSPVPGSLNIPGLHAGTVTVNVTDGQGCTASATVTLTAPVNCCQLTVSANIAQPSCGLSDGSITVTAQTGTGNYTYAWSNGNSTSTISSIGVGTYFVTITDLGYANCSVDTSFSLSNSSAPTISAPTVVNETCAGTSDGSVTVNAAGGTGNYTYSWNNGQSTVTAVNLTAGTYTYTVTDGAGCQASGSATVTAGICCTLQASAVASTTTCGLNNGSITTTITTQGVVPYSYSLNGGSSQASGSFGNLSAGSYTIIVTDLNGCADTIQTTVAGSANNLNITLNATNSSCFGINNASIQSTVTGSTGNLTYTWSDGSNGTAINNLTPGTYSVIVTDAQGCTASGSSSVSEPAALSIDLGQDVSACDGEVITVNGPVGFASYNWSSGEQTANINITTAAQYSLTVTDANGCTATDAVNATFIPQPVVNLGDDRDVYAGDVITLSANITSTLNGTYNWQPDSVLSCSACTSPTFTAVNSTTFVLVYQTDPYGCTSSDTININVLESGEIVFPNAFTPNGDGNNDIYLPVGKPVKQIQWKIYNRWGEKVFDSNSQYIGWNGVYKGADQPMDVYIYYAEVVYMNNQTRKFKGSLTLLR